MAAQAIQTVPAIYEDGRLRPLEPLDLPEHTRVQVTVAVAEDTSEISDQELDILLVAAGLQIAEMPSDGEQPLSREALDALIREIGPGVALSQAILEDRDGR